MSNQEANVTKERKKPGPKPMTPAEKEAAKKRRAAEKKKAENLTPGIVLQYQNAEIDVMALVEAAKTDFKAQHKRTLITDLKLYLKPEDSAAYYVINGSNDGKVDF